VSKRILYLQYSNPAAYPPLMHSSALLMHSSALLAEAGWNVLMLGIGVPSVDRLEMPKHKRIRYQAIGGPSGGGFGALKYARFVARSVAAARRFKPDWCYASDTLSAPAINAIRAAIQTRVLYHEHDTPAAPVSMFQQFAMRAREALTRGAEVVVAPAQARLASIPPGNGQRFVVWNCPRRSEAGAPRVPATGKFRIGYHGSLSRDRLTPQFVDALALLPNDVELHFIGYETAGHHNYIRELRQRAEQLCVSERVRYHGTVPQRADLLERLRAFDLGISTVVAGASDPNLETLAGASNKAFEYLASGAPLLVSRHVQWQEMYEQPGLALACDPTDAASIAQAIRQYLAMPDRGHAMGEAGRRRILDEWNYETQFAPVMAALSA
jgi:glycosyltransferase involved in cell wall biosynthesis